MNFCPNCGAKLPENGLLYCQNCGYKLSEEYNVKSNKNSNDDIITKSKEFMDGFLKGIRNEVQDNETIDDVVTHAKIIWHGPKTEKEKAYKERKRKEKEAKDPIGYKISEVTGKYLFESQYFIERKKLFNVSDGYTYYKDILKWEVDNYGLEYEDIEARLDELLKINDAKTLFELRLKKPTYLFKTREDLKQYIGHGTAEAPIPITDEEIEKLREMGFDRSVALDNILSEGKHKKEYEAQGEEIPVKIKVDNNINQKTEKSKQIAATTKEKEISTKKTAEPDYSNFELSELEETLIKTLPIINNPSEYEENIINKYAEYNSNERKELLKDCWTVTKLANEHNIKRQVVEKTILTDEFLNNDLIGVFKVNPKNIRSLKILYRKPLTETEKPATDVDVINEVNEIPKKHIEEENIAVVDEVVGEEILKHERETQQEVSVDETVISIKEPVREKSVNTSNKTNQNNKKKKRKGLLSKLAEKNDEMVEEQNMEIKEKILSLIPKLVEMLNTTQDNLYVASVRVYGYVRGTKNSYMQFGRQIFIMTLNNNNISYIPFADIVRDNIRYFESWDILSISFKNISSISNKRIGYIELEMNGSDSFAIETKDLFGKQINNELLEKYNNFISSSNVAENNSSSQSTTSADELLKYAELYKQGLLTKEEFEAKKKELL